MENKIQNAEYWKNRSINDEERDWKETGENWVDDYVKSVDHPHRNLIIDVLYREIKTYSFNLFEAGCSAGPNLLKIHRSYPFIWTMGCDVNEESIKKAKEVLSSFRSYVYVGDFHDIKLMDKSFDVSLADAVLMYSGPNQIEKALDELVRITEKLIIIVERVSEVEENNGYIWSRNYPRLMENRGCGVEIIKLDETTWPGSLNWQKYGYVIICKLPQKDA